MEKCKPDIRTAKNHEKDYVKIPRETYNDILEMSARMESITETLEVLGDDDAMKSLTESRKDIACGKFKEGSIDNLEETMAK